MVNTLAVDNEAKHTIEALRSELQKTQAKLQAVEELKGQSGRSHCTQKDWSWQQLHYAYFNMNFTLKM